MTGICRAGNAGSWCGVVAIVFALVHGAWGAAPPQPNCDHKNTPNALAGNANGQGSAQFKFVADCEKRAKVTQLFHVIDNLDTEHVLTCEWKAAFINRMQIEKYYCVSYETPAPVQVDTKAVITHGPGLQWPTPAPAYISKDSQGNVEDEALTARLAGLVKSVAGKVFRIEFSFVSSLNKKRVAFRVVNGSDDPLKFRIDGLTSSEWKQLTADGGPDWAGSFEEGFYAPRGRRLEFSTVLRSDRAARLRRVHLRLLSNDGDDICNAPAVIYLPSLE